MSGGSFTKKMLEARITLATGSFSGGYNTKILRLGMDATIQKPGGKEKNKCKLRVYNMALDDMEQLCSLAFSPLKTSKKNVLALYAGDAENGLSLAFSGDILSAVPDFNSAPDPGMLFECVTGYVASITPTPPLTQQGDQDVAQALERLAGQMGLSFSNRGVSGVSLRNTCWIGGPRDQAQQIADAARIALIIDDGEMIIAPPGQMRQDDDGDTPVWKDSTGLFGYPSFSSDGIAVRGLYEPKCKIGGPIRIESIVPRASGLWQITGLTHSLKANYGGADTWETQVKATYPGQQKKKDAKK